MKCKTIVVTLVLTLGCLLFAAMPAPADEAKFELKVSATMRDILAERTGKRTTLRLSSGEDIEGTVTMVGNGLVHVSKLTGKDFYDAVIEIDRISAVIMRVRER